MNTHGLAPLLFVLTVAGCGGGGDGSSAASTPVLRGDAGMSVDGDVSRNRTLASTTAFDNSPGSQLAPMYALDFVGTAATGFDLNDVGDVVGKSYTDPGCGPFCLPPQENVVWKGGTRLVLPLVPGVDGNSQYPFYINNQGLIGGEVGIIGSATRAAIWTPNDTGYIAQDLGVFPGTSSVDVFGLDDQGRMIGWATLGGAIPSVALPFMWSQSTGMVDLRALGYPNERPAAMSPGGKVVTSASWYQLGDPGSAVALPPPPQGFLGAGSNGSAINDAGDQAHFLVSTSSQNLVYPFRLSKNGTWQQLYSGGTGRLSRYGMGSISAGQDVTFTALSTGMIAAGPTGVGRTLASLVSPAYPGATVGDGGPMNASGQILTQVMIGRSQRLMKMTPAEPCGTDCIVSSSVVMAGRFVQDPALPGSCVQGGKMYNTTEARVTITSESGAPLGNVQVSGRFLDDYWTNRPVTGTTDASGNVTWTHKGLCGVGAVAFLVENASLGTRRFDRTRGVLTSYVIPSAAPLPPEITNRAPVAVPAVTCSTGKVCTFNGTGSYDPDGTIVAWRWTETNGSTLSTKAEFTMTFNKSGKHSAVLHVTDNGGLSASKKIMFDVLR
jgi:hypothetical protein